MNRSIEYCLFHNVRIGDVLNFITMSQIKDMYKTYADDSGPQEFLVPGTINEEMIEMAGIELRVTKIESVREYDIDDCLLAPPAHQNRDQNNITSKLLVEPVDKCHPEYERHLELCKRFAYYTSMFVRKRPTVSIEKSLSFFQERTFDDLIKEEYANI